ncbi:MAG TPA: 16S rRNA (guanine(527)-N(7))-methyltransferase RsmG [Nocardioides sp.]|uniref:16S rRNA (guanine(527)-N(7))-methyltransferase RsmG n=1 Tax=Nocardioides sp. TaxID=35761 RepID=UPI002B6DEAFB|nr:16S rRNA (guanine(527)-N(7))-methyltransferase RsmG [Nocardioides sp.]HQR26810.1 16S rRNA (guanine(527)-N(7))-methyltransferase RsmG [Nocardioides sp.]
MVDVSRETPEAARLFFPGERLALAERYAGLLAGDGVVRGLIGPREGARLWSRHLLNCAALAELIPPEATVCDVGSGAGLPGVVLAVARADLQVTLVEPMLRRTSFLEEVVASLGLGNVVVVRGRAESLHGSGRFDVVTSRAVAPLPRLLEWSMPLVAPDGVLLAMKGSTAAAEILDAAPVLEAWHCAPAEVLTVAADIPEAATTVVRVAWAEPAQVGWRGAPPPREEVPARRAAVRRRRKQKR